MPGCGLCIITQVILSLYTSSLFQFLTACSFLSYAILLLFTHVHYDTLTYSVLELVKDLRLDTEVRSGDTDAGQSVVVVRLDWTIVFVELTRKMVPIKKRVGSFLILFHHSCSFYLLDQRTISGVDILEMTWKDGMVILCPYYGHLPGL